MVLKPTPHVSGLSYDSVEIFLFGHPVLPVHPEWSACQGMQVLLGNTPWRCAHPLALSRRDVFPSMPSKAGRRGPFCAPDTDPSLSKGARGHFALQGPCPY